MECNNKLLFSIIIPVYRVENYVRECVESVLRQSFHEFEIVLVDDGSPDNCPAICDEYANNYPCMIKVLHKENGGLSDARNRGTEAACGEYIIYLDSDDYWDSTSLLEDLAKEIEARNAPDLILYQGKKLFESTGNIVNDPCFDVNIINSSGKKEIIKYLINSQSYSMSACTKALNKDFLIKAGIKFEKGLLGEDLDWYFQVIFNAQTICAISNCCYVYRIRNGSITTSFSIKNENDQIKIIRRWKKKVMEAPITDEDKKPYLAILSYAYMVALLNYAQLNEKDRKSVFAELNAERDILSFADNKKSRITYAVTRVFGLRITSHLLYNFYRLTRK